MADSQGNNSTRLRRNISKIAFRNKERVMRTIGRAEETKDEIIDNYVMLINKQQLQMQKLQRDMKQYLQAIKAMSLSQKAFYSSLYEVYDDEWDGKDVVASCSQRNESLYDDIFARFQSEVLELLQNHLSEYQKCKTCIEKRGRKLVDYDAARRAVQAIEASRKPDQTKVDKSREHLRQAQEIYEELNNFLHQQLPTLYDSRLSVCVNIFSSICESENVFSSDVSELRTKLSNVLSNLKTSFDNGNYRIQRMQTPLDNGAQPMYSASTVPRLKIPPTTEQFASVHNSDTMPAPKTPSENEVVKPSNASDPSAHEYVNLQIGPISVAEKPEDEQAGGGDNNQSKKKKSKRPASMFVASSVKLSTTDGEAAKEKDGDKKKEKSQKDDKPQKGLFGMLGKRLSRSTKNLSATAPLSVPPKESAPPEENREVTGEGSGNVVPPETGTSERHDDDRQAVGDEANDYSEIGASAVAAREQMKNSDPTKAAQEQSETDDSAKATGDVMQNGDSSNAAREDTEKSDSAKVENGDSSISARKQIEIDDSAKFTEQVENDDSAKSALEKKENGDSAKAEDENEAIMNSTSMTYATVQKKSVSAEEPRQIGETVEDRVTDRNHPDQSENAEDKTDPPLQLNDSKSDEENRENFADQSHDFTDQNGHFADEFFRDDGFVHFDHAAGATVDESTAFGEVAGPVSEGFEDGFGDSFSAPAPAQVDGFSNEPFDAADPSPDVALDLDESVFDPDTPISPGHFESVGGGDSGFKADFSQFDNAQFESGVNNGNDNVRNEVLQPESENPDSDLAKNDTIALSNSGDPELSSFEGVSEDGGAVLKSASEDEFALCYEDTAGVGVKMPDVNCDTHRPRDIVSHDAPADLDSLPSDDDAEMAGNVDSNLVAAIENSVVVTATNAGKLNYAGDEIVKADRDVLDDNRMQSDARAAVSIANEEGKEVSTASEPQGDDLDMAAQSTFPRVSGHSVASDEGHDTLDRVTGVVDTDADAKSTSPQAPGHSVLSNTGQDSQDQVTGRVNLDTAAQSTGQDVQGHSVSSDERQDSPGSGSSPSELPLPHEVNHDVSGSSEISPIYEEPPRDDFPEERPSGRINHPPFPPNYLFSVQALYQFRSTDDDELSFDKGDVVHVIVHPDPEEQDDGWQMGFRQTDWDENGGNAIMGVFPENFTKRVPS